MRGHSPHQAEPYGDFNIFVFRVDCVDEGDKKEKLGVHRFLIDNPTGLKPSIYLKFWYGTGRFCMQISRRSTQGEGFPPLDMK